MCLYKQGVCASIAGHAWDAGDRVASFDGEKEAWYGTAACPSGVLCSSSSTTGVPWVGGGKVPGIIKL